MYMHMYDTLYGCICVDGTLLILQNLVAVLNSIALPVVALVCSQFLQSFSFVGASPILFFSLLPSGIIIVTAIGYY